ADHDSGSRIVDLRQFVIGDEALPFAFAGGAVHRNIARATGLAQGNRSAYMKPDVAVGIGINEVLRRAGVSAQGIVELLPACRLSDPEKRKLEMVDFRSRPAQRVAA